jgi:hypothetical protein
MRRTAAGVVLVLISLAALPKGASAQETELACARLLTAGELKAAAGPGFEAMGPQKRKDGETECNWLGRQGGFRTVAFSFFEPPAIEGSIAAHFDSLVKWAEEVASTKHEPVAGVGERAVLVRHGDQLRMLVQTKAGVGMIVANGLTKAQAEAVGKAVATS